MASGDKKLEISRRRFLVWTGALAASAGVVPLLSACGAPAAQPTAAAKPTAAAPAKAVAPTQPPAKEGMIQLKFAHHESAAGAMGKAYQAYADAVNQKSGGKLFITVYPSETLGKAADGYQMVLNGIADMAWTPVVYMPGQFPLTDLYNLPMHGVTSAPHGARAAAEWVKTNPAVQKEWSDVKVLAAFATAAQTPGIAKKKVTKLEDMAGLKMMVAGGAGPSGYMKAIGANPVAIPVPELYESLSKGVVEGFLTTWQSINANRLYEVTKYVLDMPVYNGFSSLSMNKKKWESLPPDLQQILVDPGLKPSVGEFFSAAFDSGEPAAREALAKAGGEVIKFSPEEIARWQAAAKPVWETWMESVKGKGFDPAKELAAYQEIVKKTK